MIQFHKHILTFGVVCGVAGLTYVLPIVFLVCVIIGVCLYLYLNNVNFFISNPTSSLKARFSGFHSWLEYVQMKGYQLSKPVEEKVSKSRNVGFAKENSPRVSISHRLSFPRSRYTTSDDNSNSVNRRNGFSRYSLSQVNSSFDSSSRLESPYSPKSRDSSSSFRDEKYHFSRISPWSDNENALRESNRRTKTVQTLAGPLLSSSRVNRSNSFDLGLFVDASSPGLATRVVQYAEDSGLVGNRSVTHQAQYSSPGQFPRVHLNRSISKLPVLSPRNSQKVARRSINVRLVSPEQNASGSRLISPTRISNVHASPPSQIDPSTKSLLETLREISRKRMHSQLDDEDDDDAKRQKKNDLESSSPTGPLPNGAIVDNDPQAKRTREDSPKQVDGQVQRPSKRFRNNEILSSLSSSRKMLQAGGVKRKTNSLDWSRSSTPVFGKQQKTTETSPLAFSAPGTTTVTPTATVTVTKEANSSGNLNNEPVTPKLPTSLANKEVSKDEKSLTPETRRNIKQMSISQTSKLKDSLDSMGNEEEEPVVIVDDLSLLQKNYPGRKNKLVDMLSAIAGDDVEGKEATERSRLARSMVTSSPAACLSTATCTTSVLPTISSSSAEASTTMQLAQTVGGNISSPAPSFSGFGNANTIVSTNNISSFQPASSASLSGIITSPSSSLAVSSSQSLVDTSKSLSSNPTPLPGSSTSVQFSFGASPSPSLTTSATQQVTTTGANFTFTPTSSQQVKEANENQPPSSTPSIFGLSGNKSNTSDSGFGNSVTFGNTSSGFNFTSSAVTTQSSQPSAGTTAPSLFSTPLSTSTSAANSTMVTPTVSSLFTSPALSHQSQANSRATPTFTSSSSVQSTPTTVGGLFGSSAAPQISKGFSFGDASGSSAGGIGTSIFGSSVSSTPQTSTSQVNSVQNSGFGASSNSQPPKAGGFSFGGSAMPTCSTGQGDGKPGGFAFGSSASNATAATSQEQPKPFGFGSQPSPASSSFRAQPTPAISGAPAFGAPGDSTSVMGGFSFLSKQNTATTSSALGASSAFQLGQPTTTANQNSSGGFSFVFGNANKPAATSSSASSGFRSMFASPSASAAATTAAAATTTTTTTASQSFQFGSSAPADKPMFSFGSANNKPSGFGSATNTPATNTAPSAGGFGSPFGAASSSANTPAGDGQQKPQGMFSFGSNSGSAFGAGNPTPTTFSFGSSSTEKKEGGFAFGSTSQPPANSSGTFNFNAGSSAPAAQNFGSGGMFGAQQPQPTPAFTFGAGSSGTSNSGGFSFGSQSNTTPAFGTGGQNSSTPVFGAAAQNNSAPAFGAPAQSGSNPFQLGNSAPAFGGGAMFSIGSGSTAPRATRSASTRARRNK